MPNDNTLYAIRRGKAPLCYAVDKVKWFFEYVFCRRGRLTKPLGENELQLVAAPFSLSAETNAGVCISLGNAKFTRDSLLPSEASLGPGRFYAPRRGLGGYTESLAHCPRNVQKS